MQHFSSSFRWITVMVMAVAWMTASNHCAMGMMAASIEKQSDEICTRCAQDRDHHEEKSGQHSEHSSLTCCKIFKSLAESNAPLAKSPLLTTISEYLVAAAETLPSCSVSISAFSANAPPGARQFTTLVLERCHPGLALPFLS